MERCGDPRGHEGRCFRSSVALGLAARSSWLGLAPGALDRQDSGDEDVTKGRGWWLTAPAGVEAESRTAEVPPEVPGTSETNRAVFLNLDQRSCELRRKMLRPADTQLEAIISSTHRVLRVGQVCFVPWVILDHVTPRHGVLAAIELGQVKVQGWVKSSSSSSTSAASRSIRRLPSRRAAHGPHPRFPLRCPGTLSKFIAKSACIRG